MRPITGRSGSGARRASVIDATGGAGSSGRRTVISAIYLFQGTMQPSGPHSGSGSPAGRTRRVAREAWMAGARGQPRRPARTLAARRHEQHVVGRAKGVELAVGRGAHVVPGVLLEVHARPDELADPIRR